MFQSLTHTDDIINRIAEPTVKLDDPVVGSPNLQIDFGTPRLPQQSFRFSDNGARISAPLQLWNNRQIIEPASMALVTCHHTGDDLMVKNTHQKQFRSDTQFALNVQVRIIPRPNQVTSPPKRHDGLLVV